MRVLTLITTITKNNIFNNKNLLRMLLKEKKITINKKV